LHRSRGVEAARKGKNEKAQEERRGRVKREKNAGKGQTGVRDGRNRIAYWSEDYMIARKKK